jgi:hypothetical protein
MQIVKTCDKCQRFTNVSQRPPEDLSFISSPWPFSQWGGRPSQTLPSGNGGVRFVVVAVDYFMKWAKAEVLSSITTKCIEKFLWNHLICRNGIPQAFVTNNGKTIRLRLRFLLRMVCQAPHKELFLVPKASIGKWFSRSYQQNHLQNFKEKA